MIKLRCAIYTRKSSEEGLEQDFNSLDAQREACAAYVLSQASEGWKLLPEQYDDGGISGGTLERPALQCLLKEVNAGRIDIIVVYKVDRLTRSLLDFSRLVEAFDSANTSFVSVTQSFNTTTSMGRLTLNMLLSFAQFEREVTAERIRDKIAASKAKGMWMGGTPPLGYRPDGRSLAVIEEHAAVIRGIYKRYRKHGNVRLVAEALASEGIKTPLRISGKGHAFGGRTFSRGQLYSILKNPIYAGDISHKDKVYPGNHTAIIPREEWDAVQQKLSDNVKGERQTREKNASLLSSLLFDPNGEPLIAVHTNKGRQRYRYYVRKGDHHGTADPSSRSLRLPAREIEQVVRQELAALLADPIALIERCKFDVPPAIFEVAAARCAILRDTIGKSGRGTITKLVERVIVHPGQLALSLSSTGLAGLLEVQAGPDTPAITNHEIKARLTRTGLAVRLVQDNGVPATTTKPDPTLIKLLIKARNWWSELEKGEINMAQLAHRENAGSSYVSRVVRLAFLAPEVIDAILAGTTLPRVDGKSILRPGAISAHWTEQGAQYLPGRNG